jgi:maltose alpha-D-glucosyltransferase/alpha-amylase
MQRIMYAQFCTMAQKILESAPASDPLWFKDAVIYEVHVRAYQDSDGDGMGDFKGLTQRLPYLADLGVTALWLLPFCPSPWKDDGYDISDYTDIHPSYGTLRDFQAFLNEAHRRGMRVITELVLNHTSDQHAWFQRSRRAEPGSKWRQYYVWSDTPERYADARIIFKDFETSNWTWDPIAKAYFWHRFYSHQPDLNFDNPEVRAAMFANLDFWFDMGVDGLRLDAVPYLYEREGTNCENLPETHAFLRELRAHIDAKYTNRMLLAEANQWPEDAIVYLGKGDECHMAFHFPLMPRLFMATRMGDRYPVTDILALTPPIPESCQWALFLRNHDELTLEMVTDEERDYMYRVYAHDRSMRINLGIRRRLAPLLENDRRRIELLNGLLFSLPGTPVIYYGDEIGMGDNFYLGDRNGVRTPMQWSRDRNAGFSTANPQRLYLPIVIDPEYHYEALNVENQQNNSHSLWWWMKRLIAQRKQWKAFGRGTLEFLNPDNRRVLAFVRSFENERILVVANLSRVAQCCNLPLEAYEGMTPVEMFGNTEFQTISEEPYFLSLGPHAFYWFSLQPKRPEQQSLRSPADAEEIPVFTALSWADAMGAEMRAEIQSYLPQLVRAREWFQGKSRLILSVEAQDVISFQEVQSWLLLLRFEYSTGDPDLYLLTLSLIDGTRAEEVLRDKPETILLRVRTEDGREGVLYGGSYHEEFRDALLGAVSRRKRYAGEHGLLVGSHTPVFRKIWQHDPNLESELCKADQTGTSIKYGERFILKLYRRVEAGTHPELEVGEYLTALRAHVNVPRLAGSLEYRASDGERYTVGVAHQFIAHETSAWRFSTDNLAVFFESALASQDSGEEQGDRARGLMGSYLDLIGVLGRRLGELHLALVSTENAEFAAEPFTELYRMGLYHALLGQKNRVFADFRRGDAMLAVEAAEDAATLLAREGELNTKLQVLRDRRLGGSRIRIHGDFDLRQALYTGKDFYIIDFEGEVERPLSERRIKRSPLRDVAGGLQSLYFAAFSAIYGNVSGLSLPEAPTETLEKLAGPWYSWASSAFLAGYLRVDGIDALLPSRADIPDLLDVLMVEQALREIDRDVMNRSEHLHLALRSVLYLLDRPVRNEGA